MNAYVVKTGDALGAIAERFRTIIEDLIKDNPAIRDPSLIFVG